MAKAIDISKRLVEFKTKIECLSDEWWISKFNDYDIEIDGIIIKILIYINIYLTLT